MLLLVLAIVSGYAMFAGMFVWAAGAQFFLIEGAETTNAFVYGGRYAATQPASVWNRPLRAVFGFFFPMAFTGFLPALWLLGHRAAVRAARLDRLVRAARRGVDLAVGARELALRRAALPRRRRMTSPSSGADHRDRAA